MFCPEISDTPEDIKKRDSVDADIPQERNTKIKSQIKTIFTVIWNEQI